MTTPFKPEFDPRWSDVPDYILGITKDIWEDRNIHTLHQYYGADLIVRSPASVIQGNTGIIAATMATLAEFPDRELPGEDVIWCDTGSDSFLSSHRLLCTATHTGTGMYGPPTGRSLTYRILADCWCQANAVHDEWLVRDQAAIVLQMGHDIIDWTRDLIVREGGPDHCVRPYCPENDIPGPYQGRGNDHPFGAQVADMLMRIMGLHGDIGLLNIVADRAIIAELPGHKTVYGQAAVQDFWLGLRSAFPYARFEIDHVIGAQDAMMPQRAAVRWHLHGRHDGWGRFGRPQAQMYT